MTVAGGWPSIGGCRSSRTTRRERARSARLGDGRGVEQTATTLVARDTCRDRDRSLDRGSPAADAVARRRVSPPMVLAAIHVEPSEFLAVVGTSAVAGTLSALVTGRGLLLPAVVV